MKRTFIGFKPGYGQVMKVMENHLDNPLTTPNSAYGKFRFNSENQVLGYITEVVNCDIVWSEIPFQEDGDGTNTYFYPTGVSETSPLRVICGRGGAGGYQWTLRVVINQSWTGYEDFIKTNVWLRVFTVPDGVAEGANLTQRKQNIDNSGAWAQLFNFRSLGPGAYWEQETWQQETIEYYRLWETAPYPPSSGCALRIQLYRSLMPGDHTPYLATAAPVSGQQTIRIDEDVVRIARRGYDVNVHGADKMILSESMIPMKLAASGLITNLAAGATFTVPVTEFPLTKDGLVLGHAHQVGTPLWNPPIGGTAGDASTIEYRFTEISGVTRVQIRNGSSVAFNIRYLVMTDNVESETSGAGKYFELKTTTGLQILRAGSSASPTQRDVLYDSRLRVLPLVKEGIVNTSGFITSDEFRLGNVMARVDFDNDGTWKPYVVAMQRLRHRTSPTDVTYRRPNMHWVRWRDPDGGTGDTFVASIFDNHVKFYGSRLLTGEPLTVSWLGTGAFTYTDYYFDAVRYYIFAIPA